MPREGPCRHCGITKTPLWRNGPPDKPVLCNACGYRWMRKGTLENYIPKHSRVAAPGSSGENECTEAKTISQNDHGENAEDQSSRCEPSETGSSLMRTSHKSFIDKLTKDLQEILQQEPSLQSESPEDILIYNKEQDPNAYFETSLGSILLKRPAQSSEEEAKDSFVSKKNKT